MTAKNERIAIVQDEEAPQSLEIMEKAIVDVAAAARKLLASRLTKRAVLVLLRDQTGLPLSQIETVLDHAAKLDQVYLRKPDARR